MIFLTQEFRKCHPFILSDGRRFKSLFAAASTVFYESRNLAPVIDERHGHRYDFADCSIAMRGPVPGVPIEHPSVRE